MNGVIRLARAELRKLFTTRALPVSFAIAIMLAIGSVIIDAMVAGKNGSPRLGTDAAVYPHGRNAEEFHQMVDLGMKPIDALKAGTSLDAELLGLADKIGTLEPNKIADVVAVPGKDRKSVV